MADIQCGAGQQLVNGVCVTIPETNTGTTNTTTTTQGLAPIEGLYQNYANALTGATQANIEASRVANEQTQSNLAAQLEQQRQDYLKNRQTLQKETFLRGRNVLANLANRGLATSGLQQLGDVQRTVATGQQMSDLTRAFENARLGLTSQQQAAATNQRIYEGQQQAGLASQLAGVNLQQRDAQIREAERVTALLEDAISAAGTATPAQTNLLNQIYAATASGDAGRLNQILQDAGVGPTDTTGTTGTTGTGGLNLNEIFGAATVPTSQQFIEGMNAYTNTLTGNERDALVGVINNSENLKQDSPFLQTLATKGDGFEITPSITQTKGGKAGLNDTYAVTIDGTQYNLEGRELAVLIMNGKVKVSPQIAVSIVQRAGGRVAQEQGTTGNDWDSILRPYLLYLQEQGFITGRQGLLNDYKILINNPIR